MKHLFKRIAASNSKVIAHIKMGDDIFNIVSRDGSVHGMYGGCDIFKCATLNQDNDRIASLVKDFVERCIAGNKCTGIMILRDKKAEDLSKFTEQLNGIPGLKKVVVKPLPEDMSEVNTSLRSDFDVSKLIDYKVLSENIRKMGRQISDLNNTLRVCREDAMTLTHGKLVDTMWGAKSMCQMIGEISKEIESNTEWERVEFFTTLIMKSIERLLMKLSSGLSQVCAEEQRVIYTVLIPNILSNYELLKSVASKALLPLSALIYIDTVFKQATNYPASWFMNGNMLEDLKQDYQKILGFMMQVPRIEKSIIYPLDFLRVQYVNTVPSIG